MRNLYLQLHESIIFMAQKNFVAAELDKDYCINISEWYCSHWEPIHALREALQNWQDAVRTKYGENITIKLFEQPALGIYAFHPMVNGVKNQKNWIKYDKVEKTLELMNESSFKVQNMLMGASSNKKDNKLALGQFGEGMKLYLLILLKHKFPVFIESGDHYYGPALKKWDYQYENGTVLYVHIKKRGKIEDNTVVSVNNIDEKMFNEFRYLSLSLVNDYSVITYGTKSLIISSNPMLKGKIFKKGILVALRYNCDSPYSYNLDDITLGRQRDSINDPQQLKHLRSQLHAQILNNHQNLKLTRNDIQDELIKHLEEVVRGLKLNAHKTWFLHSYINVESANRIYRYFLKQNQTGELYPLHTTKEQKDVHEGLSNYGLPRSFYPTKSESWSYCCNLYKSSSYQTIKQKIDKQIKVGCDLTDAQKNQLKPMVDNIALSLPQINSYQFKIYELQNIPCFKEPGKTILNLNKKQINHNKDLFKLRLMELVLKDLLK